MVEIDNVVLDELHLMLRVTDRLEEGLILDVINWDSVSKEINSINLESQDKTKRFYC